MKKTVRIVLFLSLLSLVLSCSSFAKNTILDAEAGKSIGWGNGFKAGLEQEAKDVSTEYDKGYNDGYAAGYSDEARDNGYDDGYNEAVATVQEALTPDIESKDQLIEIFIYVCSVLSCVTVVGISLMVTAILIRKHQLKKLQCETR